MNIELRDKEEDHMEGFRNFCKEKEIVLPEGYDDETRFRYSRGGGIVFVS